MRSLKLLERAQRETLPLELREAAAASITKNYMSSEYFLESVLTYIDSPECKGGVRRNLLNVIGEYAQINSVTEANENALYIMNHIRKLTDGNLIAEYLRLFFRPQILETHALAFLSSYFFHSDANVRLSAVQSFLSFVHRNDRDASVRALAYEVQLKLRGWISRPEEGLGMNTGWDDNP